MSWRGWKAAAPAVQTIAPDNAISIVDPRADQKFGPALELAALPQKIANVDRRTIDRIKKG